MRQKESAKRKAPEASVLHPYKHFNRPADNSRLLHVMKRLLYWLTAILPV